MSTLLRPGTRAMTAVLALLTALGPLSTDFYLPSLPEVVRAFATDVAGAQSTLSAFLFGFAAGQIVWGPLSDRYGRRPALLAGLALFLAGTLGCALAPSLPALVAARAAQALGASGPIVLARAIVRDLYDGPAASRELARMAMVMGVVPMLVPTLGGVLQDAFGWRSTFVATLVLGGLLSLVVLRRLPETVPARSTAPLSLGAILRGFGVLARHPRFRVYVAVTTLLYAGLFAFISGSAFVLIGRYGLSPVAFGAAFALVSIGYVGGTLLAQALLGPRGPEAVLALGVATLAVGGLAMLACVAAGLGGAAGVVGPMMVYACGVGMALPQGQALAMTPFPERAGAASSLLGLCQMLVSAFVGLGVGAALGDSPLPLPIALAALGTAALVTVHLGRR
jgi:MFS transporter, DHA1 family, multidrug resistance protein